VILNFSFKRFIIQQFDEMTCLANLFGLIIRLSAISPKQGKGATVRHNSKVGPVYVI